MEWVNVTVKDSALVLTKKETKRSKQNGAGLKIIQHALSKSLVEAQSHGSAQRPGGLLLDFDIPQTGRRRESRHKELEHRKKSRGLAKDDPSSIESARAGSRASSSRSRPLRSLAPAVATPQSQPPGSIPQGLDGWIMHEGLTSLSEAKKHAIRSYLDVLERRTYPYGHGWNKSQGGRPPGTADTYANIMQDFSLLQCAISIGAINDLVHRRAKEPTPLAYHRANLCSLLNSLLGGPQEQSRQVIIVQGIVALALISLMVGEYQEWHTHMKALKSLLPNQKSLPLSLQWLAFRTDLVGSCELAVKPYLTIQRRHPSILSQVDTKTHTYIDTCVRQSLSICCCNSVLETFVSIGLLGTLVACSSSAARLDADPLMEQSYILWSELLTRPVPMWDLQRAMLIVQASEPTQAGLVAATRTTHLDAAIDAFAFPRCIELAMRITLLLYAKKMSSYQGDLVWKRPDLFGVYIYCLQVTLAGFQQSTGIDGDATAHQNPSAGAVAVWSRPAVIWLCLMGWAFGKLLSASKSDMAVFCELLVHLVGRDPSAADTCPDSDLEFCHIYSVERIVGHKWSARSTMKVMIEAYIN